MPRRSIQYRLDANHNELVKVYRDLGCSVEELAKWNYTIDLAVGCVGITDFVEIKTESGPLKPSQVTFDRDWRGRKLVIVRTQADVIEHVRRMRQGK